MYFNTELQTVMYRIFFYFIFLLIFLKSCNCIQKARDNGDIYIVTEEKFSRDIKYKMQTESSLIKDFNTVATTTATISSNIIDFDDIITMCNSSFSIPLDYYIKFNSTSELPDLVDKTAMCFIRCLYEKSGLIENWKLNRAKIMENIWPATGDSIEVCEKEGAGESNACVRTYFIAKCLTIRSIVDARNKPV